MLDRLARGAYVLADAWSDVFPETTLRTRAHAVDRRMSDELAVFAGCTAAAFWELALYRVRSDVVDMIVPRAYTRRNAPDVIRHQGKIAPEDVVMLDGVRVTSLDRTVYDVIRSTSMETAVVAFDAALRRVAWDDELREYDEALAEAFRAKVEGRIRRGTGARGIRQAREVTPFADGRAQLPGESVARLWMSQLGVPRSQLQHRVSFPGGGFALLDFAWPELGRWMEFDGEVKYHDAAFMSAETADEVLAAQSAREERIKQVTGWRCERFGFERMPSFGVFAAYLRSIGMR
jgi:hypothetical protein